MKVIKSNWAEWIENIIAYGLAIYALLLPYYSWYYFYNGVSFIKVLLVALLFFIGVFVLAFILGLIVYIISYPFSKPYISRFSDCFVYKNTQVKYCDIKVIRYNFSKSYRNHHEPSYAYIMYNNDYIRIERFSPFLIYKIKQYNPNVKIKLINFKTHFFGFPLIMLIIGIIGTIIEHFV